MEREEILEQIKKLKQQIEDLKGQIIDFELPKNYDKMSKEEKKAYHKKQEKLKQEALNNLDYYSVIINNHTIVKYPKSKDIILLFKRNFGPFTSIPLIRDTFKRTTPEKFKELHKEKLVEIEKLIERYNSTKAIRNDRVEFGANFLNFIETYFSKLACLNLDRLTRKEFLKKYDRQLDKNGNTIGDKFKFQNLSEEQRKDLIKIRIKMFAEKLNSLQAIAEAKVRIDSKQKIDTYLERHGLFNKQIAFRNGSKKFTTVKSVISKTGIDISKARNYKSELKKKSLIQYDREETNKSKLLQLNVMREKFDKFVKFYKGNGRQFSIEFEQNFPEIAKKVYNQETDNILAFRNQNLASSPISVQTHEIEKQFDEELRKINYRLRSSAFYIPSSVDTSSGFLGKILTNSKTKAEKNLDTLRIKEYEKELKNIAMRETLVGYDVIVENLNKSIKKDFLKHIRKNNSFDKKSEISKKKELKIFISNKIEKLKETVNKNKFFSLGTEKLEKLNGVLIDKQEKVMSKEVRNVFESLGQEQGEKYKFMLQQVKDLTNKYNNEKLTLDKLGESLEKLNSKPYSVENNTKIHQIIEDINSHNKKIAIIKSSLNSAVQRKELFEQNFATEQINKSMKSKETKAVVFNTSKSVFDKYAFPAIDAFGETYYIEKASLEGKQVEKVVASFIMNFKNYVQNMKLSFSESNVVEIQDYIGKLTSKICDDFGSTIRDLKKTQKFFISQIEEMQKSSNKAIQLELEKYVQRLSKIESELIKKLKAMNIEIGDVTLLKNQNKQ